MPGRALDAGDAENMMLSNVVLKYSVATDLWEAQSTVDIASSGDFPVAGFNTHIPSKRTLLPEYPVVGSG